MWENFEAEGRVEHVGAVIDQASLPKVSPHFTACFSSVKNTGKHNY